MDLDIPSYNKFFCDSEKNLQLLIKNGLKKNSKILTFSPYLLSKKDLYTDYKILNISENWSYKKLKLYQISKPDFYKKLYNFCQSKDELKKYSMIITRFVSVSSRFYFKAGFLKDRDIIEKAIVVFTKNQSILQLNYINPPWDHLLKRNENIDFLYYDYKFSKKFLLSKPSFLSRLKIAGKKIFFYKVLLKTYSKLSFLKNKKKNFYIYKENELIIDTAIQLMKKLYFVKKIDLNDIDIKSQNNFDQLNQKILNLCNNEIKSMIRHRLQSFMDNKILESCLDHTIKELISYISEFNFYYSEWNKLSFLKEKNITVLTNYPGNNKDAALFKILRDNNNNFASFQHGVFAEISNVGFEELPRHEANCSNIFFSYNDRIKKKFEESPFNLSKIYTVGMPSTFNKNKLNHSRKDVLYVAMNLYRGNNNLLTGYLTDYERYLYEKEVVDMILSRSNKNIYYKPYPMVSLRYTDNDPIYNHLELYNNITILDNDTDLRYIVDRYKLIICTGGSSTLSWIIMANLPMIFINNPLKAGIDEEIIDDFKDSLIFFDTSDFNYYKKVVELLNKPYDEIEKIWFSKENSRKKLVIKYFSKFSENAGKRTSEILIN